MEEEVALLSANLPFMSFYKTGAAAIASPPAIPSPPAAPPPLSDLDAGRWNGARLAALGVLAGGGLLGLFAVRHIQPRPGALAQTGGARSEA